jgi:dolichyl-diphosphooligosaccharide--protein glycosyltransferase
VDDYRNAYLWLKENTPEDARIMAWWDYGYQIAGIANRTTLADGNTWNHEHIALLGYTLTSPEKEAHRIARHLADYVLVWAGGGGDDMNKSPHLRRIANSVYRDICSDPTCRDFNIYVSTLGLGIKILFDVVCLKLLGRHYAHLLLLLVAYLSLV